MSTLTPDHLYILSGMVLPPDRTVFVNPTLGWAADVWKWCAENLQPGWKFRDIPSREMNSPPGCVLITATPNDVILFLLRWGET